MDQSQSSRERHVTGTRMKKNVFMISGALVEMPQQVKKKHMLQCNDFSAIDSFEIESCLKINENRQNASLHENACENHLGVL